MKKLGYALKKVGILVCVVLFVAFLFLDIIDLFIPGGFPDWVYAAELISWVVFGVVALVMYIRKRCMNKN